MSKRVKFVTKCKVKGAKCPRCKYSQVVADPRGGEWHGCTICREVWKNDSGSPVPSKL